MEPDFETLTETEWEQVNRVWDLLDQEDLDDTLLDRARATADALLRERPGHPDLLVLDAEVSLAEGEPGPALEALRGAERSADPARFFFLRALAHYQLVHFEEAREDGLRAAAVHPELPEVHDLLSRVYDHLGDPARSRRHLAEARAIDPVVFLSPLEVNSDDFQRLVEEAVAELPAEYRRKLEELNVPILVEDLPGRALLTAAEPPLDPDLLGLFVGRTLLERQHDDLPGVPEAIYLFRRNLLRICADRQELRREVAITVRHELGHLLGGEEGDLTDWGLA